MCGKWQNASPLIIAKEYQGKAALSVYIVVKDILAILHYEQDGAR